MSHSQEAHSPPVFSVVIPTYNRAVALSKCLSSLVTQSFKQFEVIVSDDGSTDHTRKVVESYSETLNIIYIQGERSGGPARPRNLAIGVSTGTYVAFLDSDDWWSADKLARSYVALEMGADLVYHDLYVEKKGRRGVFPKVLRSTRPMPSMFLALLCDGISIPNSSVVVRRTLLTQIGGIREQEALRSVEDFDTWVRCALVGCRFKQINGILGYYTIGEDNISAEGKRQIFRIKRVYGDYMHLVSPEDQSKLSGFLAYRIGRMSFSFADYRVARVELIKALKSPIRLRWKMRAILFLIWLYVHGPFHS